MRRGLVQSGGGSRIDVLLMAMKIISIRYRPDWLGGVSSGLLACLAYEFDVVSDVLQRAMNDDLRWIKRKPIDNDGRITWSGIWNIISGKNYLGAQEEDKMIQLWITEEQWERYRRLGNPIYGMCVAVEDGERWVQDLRCLSYEDMLLFVSASCRVPFWTKPVAIRRGDEVKHWADGGWRDHNPSVIIMSMYERDTTELVSISTRPIVQPGYPTGLLGMLSKVIGIYGVETTLADEEIERMYCKDNNIRRYFRRLRDCKNHPYDTDASRSIESVRWTMEDMTDFDW